MISFEKSVGVVVFRENDNSFKYLLLHYEAGHWDFPKGHQEKGENDEMTLRRELIEETGIKEIEIVPSFRKEICYFYQAKGGEIEKRKKRGNALSVSKKVIYYLAETKLGKVKLSSEHIGYEWLEYEPALARITYPNGKEVIREVQAFLGR